LESAGSSSSSSSSGQAAASTAFLATLLVRHLLLLADALEAVGSQLYYNCLMRYPRYKLMWQVDEEGSASFMCRMLGPRGGEQQHTVEVQWLQALQPLLACMRSLGMAPTAAAAAAAAGAEEGPAQPPADAATATSLLAGQPSATVRGCTGSHSTGSDILKQTAAAAAPSRSSGPTCCACSRPAHAGQQQW
jgi:hypothetical protein